MRGLAASLIASQAVWMSSFFALARPAIWQFFISFEGDDVFISCGQVRWTTGPGLAPMMERRERAPNPTGEWKDRISPPSAISEQECTVCADGKYPGTKVKNKKMKNKKDRLGQFKNRTEPRQKVTDS